MGKAWVLGGHVCRHLHAQQKLSLKVYWFVRGIILGLPGTCASHTWSSSRVGELKSKDLKLDFWVLTPALPLAHCQILIKLFNVSEL